MKSVEEGYRGFETMSSLFLIGYPLRASSGKEYTVCVCAHSHCIDGICLVREPFSKIGVCSCRTSLFEYIS